MKRLSLLIAALALRAAVFAMLVPGTSGPAAAQETPADTPPGTVDILDDRGGNVLEALARRSRLERWGGPVRIRGYCRSACTLYLSLPNACLGGRATVGFHAPRIPGTDIIPPLVGEIMGRFYRGEIRRRWEAEWQYSLRMTRLSAAEYRRLDPQMRICGGGAGRG